MAVWHVEQGRLSVDAAPAPLSLARAFLHSAFAPWLRGFPLPLDFLRFAPVQS